ncbi:MAG: L,D-transpeptidase family protein [Bacteroidales bacterium]|nr:L,D-transpeptidase family protein [Clostridium sp.]MCM1202888.1 L,D-transpeptidase family protein [Bacteroidales bacterium]
MRVFKACGRFLILSVVCGMLVVGNSASADKVIPAKPEKSTTQETKKEQDKTTEITTEVTTEDTTSDVTVPVTEGWSEDHMSYLKGGKKVTGFKTIDGKKYYFKPNGRLYTKTGMRRVKGKVYFFSKAHTLRTGVVRIKNKYYYFKERNGQRYDKTGVRLVDGKYYCFKWNHTLLSGWYRSPKNKLYYFSTKNYQAVNGWQYIGQYKLYFNKRGVLNQDVRSLLTEKQKSSYMIYVNRAASCVTVYTYDEATGYYTVPVVAFVCSAGKETPLGTFHIRDKLRWHELIGPSWGQWCEHLTTDILFHSVFYDRKNDNHSLNVKAYNQLGTVASHGCIRLTAGDAKWIYDNCKVGTRVVIYDDASYPGPFDKPQARKLAWNQTWDPTDPNP